MSGYEPRKAVFNRKVSSGGQVSEGAQVGKRTLTQELTQLRRSSSSGPHDMPEAGAQGGAPLAPPVRARMEDLFGANFGAVRIHQDGGAEAAGALGYANGNHIHLAAGLGDPSTHEGRDLLGHELAHVVQQRQGRVSEPQARGGAVEDPVLEAEADAAGAAVAAGLPSPARGDSRGASPSSSGVQFRKPKKPKHELLYVGMGDGASDEKRALEKRTQVVGVTDSKVDDHVKVGKKDYDLTDDTAIEEYLEALGIEASKVPQLVAIMQKVGPDARDEVAQIIRIYQEAESGARVLERVVLSGHSVGSVIWGDHNGMLEFSTMVELSGVFPGAVGQVRAVMLSACFSGQEGTMDVYRQMFPNLESIWAYSGSSPGAFTGAQQHMKIWESATRGKGVPDMAQAHKDVARLPKGDEVATWTSSNGYQGDLPLSLEDARRAVEDAESTFQDYFTGVKAVSDPGNGPLFEYYHNLQRLVGHVGIDASEKVKWAARVDITVRLRYFTAKVLSRFAETYKAQLATGYKEASRTQPVWGKLTRAGAIAEVQAFAPSAGLTSATTEAYRLMEQGLHQLDPSIITSQMV